MRLAEPAKQPGGRKLPDAAALGQRNQRVRAKRSLTHGRARKTTTGPDIRSRFSLCRLFRYAAQTKGRDEGAEHGGEVLMRETHLARAAAFEARNKLDVIGLLDAGEIDLHRDRRLEGERFGRCRLAHRLRS